MREIVVASGKGGTGKTTVAASLAVFLSKGGEKVVAVDADVDAPNLALALGGGKRLSSVKVEASEKAEIQESKCVRCGACLEACQFGAISAHRGQPFIHRLMCEGCGACELVCHYGAITMKKRDTGEIVVEETPYGFRSITGYLKLGEHNSGHIVTKVKELGREVAGSEGAGTLVVDAAPGIGCSVIASISGASYVIVVTEPTPAARRNLGRLAEVINHFRVPAGVVMNRSDISDFGGTMRGWIEDELGYPLLGEVPLDGEVLRATIGMRPVIEFNPKARASKSLVSIFRRLEEEKVYGWDRE